MNKKRLIITGGALAGPTAAARFREYNEDFEIILLERNRDISYATCALSTALGGEISQTNSLNNQQHDYFKKNYNIDVRTGTELLAIDAKSKNIEIQHNGKQETLAYEVLIYSTGVESIKPKNLPLSCQNLIAFRTMGDLDKIKEYLQSGKSRIMVIGGGALGLEAVDGLIEAGAQINLIEKEATLLSSGFGNLGALALHELKKKGVKIHLNTSIKGFKSSGNQLTVIETSSGESIIVDLVITAIGVRSRSEILAKAGAKLNEDGSIYINARCQTSLPGIYACGTGVGIQLAGQKKAALMPLGAIADKTSQIAGANAAGKKYKLAAFSGSQIIKVGSLNFGRTGLINHLQRQPNSANAVQSITISTKSKEAFMPDNHDIFLELFYHQKTRKLLGIEMVSEAHILNHLDAVSALIYKAGTIDDLAAFDLAYAPHYRPVRDPVNVAANLAVFTTDEKMTIMSPQQFLKNAKSCIVINMTNSQQKEFFDKDSIQTTLEQIRNNALNEQLNKPAILVSEHGKKAWLAYKYLSHQGIKNIQILGGGLSMLKAIKGM